VQDPLLDALGDLLGGIASTLRATQRNAMLVPGGPALSFNRSAVEPEVAVDALLLADADAGAVPSADERAVDALFGL